jgi:uncharacterized protein (TIGR02594 family)
MTDLLMPAEEFVRLFKVRAHLHGHYDAAITSNVGPITLAALDAILPAPPQSETGVPPWITIGMTMLGKHEVRDKATLSTFLRNGKFLGDPQQLPWCGDFAETCIRMALTDEVFSEKLAANPFWALNWLELGYRLEDPALGCVCVKSRDGGGHVTFAVGRSQDGQTVYCLGGNQSNEVNIAAYRTSDFRGFRWPKTGPSPRPLPVMDGRNLPRSVSEF